MSQKGDLAKDRAKNLLVHYIKSAHKAVKEKPYVLYEHECFGMDEVNEVREIVDNIVEACVEEVIEGVLKRIRSELVLGRPLNKYLKN